MSKAGSRSLWRMSSLGELASYTNGRAFKKEEWKEKGLPIIRIQNLNDPDAAFNYTDAALEPRYRVRHGDLLVSWAASLGAHIWQGGDAWVNQHIFRVEPREEVASKKYLFYALKKGLPELYTKAHGSGMVHVTRGVFDSHPVPLPPREEQDEIVAEIEKQFSRLDEAVANLKRVKANLKRYKAAVLKAAVEGRLVSTDAELAHRNGSTDIRLFEIAAVISSVQTKKRAGRLWGSGHVPALTDEERAALPEGWVWVKVRDLGHSPEDAVQVGPMSMKSSDFAERGVPVLNVGCVQWGAFDESRLEHLPLEIAERFGRYRIEPGDVLFTRSGTVGRCAVARSHQKGWLMTFHLLRARVNSAVCLPDYLRVVLEGATHIRRQTREASIGSTRAGFNTNLLGMLDVPLPPLAEQHRIVGEVARHLSNLGATHSQATATVARGEALRQAVLSRALTGSRETVST